MRREPIASSRKAQSEIGQDEKYWRLVETTEEGALYVRLVGVDDHGEPFPAGPVAMWEAEEHGGLPEWELCPWLQPHKRSYRVVYNALILANALDYSALSPETCKALRELGVKIPEEVRK